MIATLQALAFMALAVHQPIHSVGYVAQHFRLRIVYCMLNAKKTCRAMEAEPWDREITSPMDCLIGGAIMGTPWATNTYMLDGDTWFVKGIYCDETGPNILEQWEATRVRR